MESETKNYLEKIGKSIRSSVTLKLLSIFILMLLLLIPMAFVMSLIEEREGLSKIATEEVSSKWATRQVVYGPVLSIPLRKTVVGENGLTVVQEIAHILPTSLRIEGSVVPQKLHRGIHEVVVYNSRLKLSGRFDNLATYLPDLEGYVADPGSAFLTLHISDLRGIKEKVILKWDGADKSITPGSSIPSVIASGITVKDILDSLSTENHSFDLALHLQGSQHLGFAPLGKETEVVVQSGWPDPSFAGAFLPDSREVGEDGFSASWHVLELNRNYPQFWIGAANGAELQRSAFGVDLLIPTDQYQKSMRSAKYALLAISLTFLTFFLVEIFNKKKVHPFQYILIGLALVLFYTLLTALSEHLGFDTAYLIASLAIISMIAGYSRTILDNIRQILALTGMLCFTYTFVYITLQVQEYALLIGSIGLTIILGLTMYLTRRVDWYALSSGGEG